jgi:hypothetical protein
MVAATGRADRRNPHVERLVWPLLIELSEERTEARLLLQGVGGRRLRGLALQREMHPLVPPVLLGMPPGRMRSS